MSETIQDKLRAIFGDSFGDAGDVCRTAADYIDSLETADCGDSSDWLTLPWGGSWRKSDVMGQGSAGASVVVQVSSGEGLRGDAKDETEARAWLADIERQLGVTR